MFQAELFVKLHQESKAALLAFYQLNKQYLQALPFSVCSFELFMPSRLLNEIVA